MAQLVITIPNAAVDRIKAAFGVSTQAEAEAAVKQLIRQRVIEIEGDAAARQSRQALITEVNAW